MVSMYSGSQFVFVKAVMEKFIKLLIDALISEPDKDPMSPYRVNIKESSTVRDSELTEKCNQCGQMCKGKRGLGIHIGRMHTVKIVNDDRKRKFEDERNLKDIESHEEMCDVCGESFVSKEEFGYHTKNPAYGRH